MTAANTAIQSAIATVDAIDTSGTLSQLPAAGGKLDGLLTDVAPMVQTLQPDAADQHAQHTGSEPTPTPCAELHMMNQ